MRLASHSLLALAVLAFSEFAGKAAEANLPDLPKAVSSFGAVVCDGYLYVYGGHAGKPHHYDTSTVLGSFHRLKLDGKNQWEELPSGPKAQGLNLVAHAGKIYRIGGMQPRNEPGNPADTHSLTDCSRYDPKTKKWENLPPLPAGRSSHDVVVVSDRLVVVGGWNLKGKGEKPVWHETALLLDLSAKKLEWESVPQPFQRRALTATAEGSKVYILGGLGAEGKPTEIFDVVTRKWSTGPGIPQETPGSMTFSPCAATVGNRILVNTATGPVYRLTPDGRAWETVGVARTPRVVARLIPFDPNTVLLVGGNDPNSGPLSKIDIIPIAKHGELVPNKPKQ